MQEEAVGVFEGVQCEWEVPSNATGIVPWKLSRSEDWRQAKWSLLTEYRSQARLCVVSSVILTVHQWLSCGVEMEEVWSRGGGLLIPRLLFADDTFLFGEDAEGLEQSLMVLEE